MMRLNFVQWKKFIARSVHLKFRFVLANVQIKFVDTIGTLPKMFELDNRTFKFSKRHGDKIRFWDSPYNDNFNICIIRIFLELYLNKDDFSSSHT